MVVKRLAQLGVLAIMIGGILAAISDTSAGAIPSGGVRAVSSVNGTQQIVKRTPTSRIVVDGSQTPEMISDEIAYRLFIPTTLVPAVPSEEDLERQTLRLARIGFQHSDRAVYVLAAAVARQRLDDVAAQRAALGSTPAAAKTPSRGAALQALKAQEVQIFADTKQRLDESLTPEGSLQLDRFIQDHVKRGIKIHARR